MSYLLFKKMYIAKKVTPEVYGFVKANLDNGVSYQKTIKLLFKNFKVRLGNTSLVLINRSWDFDDYCLINQGKRKVSEPVKEEVKDNTGLQLLLIALVIVIGFILYTIF